MSNIKYAISNFDIVLIIDGGAKTVGLSHPNYLEICRRLQAGDLEQAVDLLDAKANIEKEYADHGLAATITENADGEIEFDLDGQRLTGQIATTMAMFKRAKLPIHAVAMFWKKFMANSKLGGLKDYVRRQDLLRFLVHNRLVLTPTGNFIAFKGVMHSLGGGLGPYPSQHNRAFEYTLNKVATEPAAKHINDIHAACGVGLHAGTIAYASGYGDVRLAVEIDPRDVVTVPSENDSHLRCWKLIPRTINPDDSDPVESYVCLDVPGVSIDGPIAAPKCVAPAVFSLRLDSYPEEQKVDIVSLVRRVCGASLAEAVRLCDNLPAVIMSTANLEEAERITENFGEFTGAVLTLVTGSAAEIVKAKKNKKKKLASWAAGGRTKKTTWYRVVAGKVIRERKVMCPPGTGWSDVDPSAAKPMGKAQTAAPVKAVLKGSVVKRTYYRTSPRGVVDTTRATSCPPGFTGVRPQGFSKKK